MNLQLVSALTLTAAMLAAIPAPAQLPESGARSECMVPIRAVTAGKAHWFGY